jgi:hypothetical protein
MTNHPLTDTICDQIQDSLHPCDPENMRAGADWQLEQVIEWLRNNLDSWYRTPAGFTLHQTDTEDVIEDLQKAMRPAETQEAK